MGGEGGREEGEWNGKVDGWVGGWVGGRKDVPMRCCFFFSSFSFSFPVGTFLSQRARPLGWSSPSLSSLEELLSESEKSLSESSSCLGLGGWVGGWVDGWSRCVYIYINTHNLPSSFLFSLLLGKRVGGWVGGVGGLGFLRLLIDYLDSVHLTPRPTHPPTHPLLSFAGEGGWVGGLTLSLGERRGRVQALGNEELVCFNDKSSLFYVG